MNRLAKPLLSRNWNHFASTITLLGTIALFVGGSARASEVSDAEVQFVLGEIAGNYEAIGQAVGDDRLVALARMLRQGAVKTSLESVMNGRDGGTVRRELREHLDATALLSSTLPKVLRLEGGFSEDRGRVSNSETCNPVEWPISSCDIPDPPNAGDPGPGGWTALVAAVAALDAVVLTAAATRSGCEGIWANPIVSFPVIVTGECIDEVFAGQGIFEVDDPGVNEWNIAGGVFNTPSACTALDISVAAARKTVAGLKSVLDCWDYGEVKASYERLSLISQELAEILNAEILIEQVLIERMLHHSSGSRPAVAYLPSANGGDLELAKQFTQEAIDNTQSAGFVMSRKAQGYLTLGNDAFLTGQFKASFDFYRRAYREATSSSRKYRPEG